MGTNKDDRKTLDKIRNSLADYAHEAWSRWMKHMFSKSKKNNDGTITIPKDLVDRWTRQMNTPYEKLPSSEQNSDLEQADKILESIFVFAQVMVRLK